MSNVEQSGTPESGPLGTPGGDDEAASWQALAADVGDDADSGADGRNVAPDGDEPAADAAPADDGADKAGADAEASEKADSKPSPEQLAEQYKAAMREERIKMREERTKRQALEQQVAQINEAIAQAKAQRQQAENQPPSIDEDPVGYFEYQQRLLADQLKETQGTLNEERQYRESQMRHAQMVNSLASQEQQFAQQTPDYWEATDHLRNTRMSQLEMIYPSTPQGDEMAQNNGFASAEHMRQAHLEQEVQMYAQTALQSGRNPAEVFYGLAKSAGYGGQKAPAKQQVTPQQKADMARAGAKRAESLSGGGGSGGNADNATAAELADLYMSDPEAADALFDKLAAAGALG